MEFQVFHRYNELATEGRCKPLVCQYCGFQQVLTIGPEDKPALKCYTCNVLTLPGLNLYNQILAVVKEWT